MAKYHVNPATGDAGPCGATQGKCPFGGESEHYSTAEDARKAYEKVMAGAPWVNAETAALLKQSNYVQLLTEEALLAKKEAVTQRAEPEEFERIAGLFGVALEELKKEQVLHLRAYPEDRWTSQATLYDFRLRQAERDAAEMRVHRESARLRQLNETHATHEEVHAQELAWDAKNQDFYDAEDRVSDARSLYFSMKSREDREAVRREKYGTKLARSFRLTGSEMYDFMDKLQEMGFLTPLQREEKLNELRNPGEYWFSNGVVELKVFAEKDFRGHVLYEVRNFRNIKHPMTDRLFTVAGDQVIS